MDVDTRELERAGAVVRRGGAIDPDGAVWSLVTVAHPECPYCRTPMERRTPSGSQWFCPCGGGRVLLSLGASKIAE